MMSEEEGVVISSTRDAQGNIKEADTPAAPGAAPVDVLNDLKRKATSDLDFIRTLKASIYKFLDHLHGRSESLKSYGEHKVNMVGKITSGGFVAVVTDVAIDGQKITDVILPNKPEYPVVAFIDLPLVVTIGATSQRVGVQGFAAPRGVTFRELPKKA